MFLVPSQYVMAFDFSSGVFKYQLKMASNGHANSQYKLGTMYATGRGTGQDMAVASEWLKKSAAQAYLPAKNYLFYLEIKQKGYDSSKHANWLNQLRQTSKGRGAEATMLLGDMYKNGIGVKRDIKIARDYYKLAYSQGAAGAESELEVLDNFLADEEKRLREVRQKKARKKQQLEEQKVALALKQQQTRLKKSQQLKQQALAEQRMTEKKRTVLKRVQAQQKMVMQLKKTEEIPKKILKAANSPAESTSKVRPEECDGPWAKHMLACN